MAKTALDLTEEEKRGYRLRSIGARAEKETEVESRRREAWDTAKKAAELLRSAFGARKVAVFGSLVHDETFGLWSDIDLAAWEIPPELFYSAVGTVTGFSPSFKVDLVDVGECGPTLRRIIEQEGMEL